MPGHETLPSQHPARPPGRRPGARRPLRRLPTGRRLQRLLAADVASLGLPGAPAAAAVAGRSAYGEPVSERRLAGLPPAARQYLDFMGVPGRPADWSFQLHATGQFRMRPSWPWLPCDVWQYNLAPVITRIFYIRITAAAVLPMTGRDVYLRGHGGLRAKLFGLIPVAAGAGPTCDVSELVTYLNDAVFCAPSMLLSLPVTWSPAGDRCFDLTLHDAGQHVRARVVTDTDGAPVDFSAEDRWCDLPSGLTRVRWTTPVRGSRRADGRWLPSSGEAIWHLPDGDFSYTTFHFDPAGIRFNVPADQF